MPDSSITLLHGLRWRGVMARKYALCGISKSTGDAEVPPPDEAAQAPPREDARTVTPFERMTELTRRPIHVPKSEIPTKAKPAKKERKA